MQPDVGRTRRRERADDERAADERGGRSVEAGAVAVDWAAVFDALPSVDLLLAPDPPRYTMLAASDGRLAATLTTRAATLGRPLFEVFADANPAHPAASGVANLRASLDAVLRTGAPHRMPVQRFDLARPDGRWEVRYWAPLNVPVRGADGQVRCLLHRVEDVTEAVRMVADGDRLRRAAAGSERARASAEAARAEVTAAHARLQLQNIERELAHQQLRTQSVELESQAAALRAGAALLGERTAVAERALAELRTSEERFRTVQDASPQGFAIHRPLRAGDRSDGPVVDFTIPYVNDAGARIVGRPREVLLAGTVRGIWPGTGPEGVFADYVRVLETGEPRYRELLYEHDELAAGLTLSIVRIGQGADAELGVTFTDVTARLRAERDRDRLLAELGAERERLRAVVLHMPSPLALHVGPEHRFALVNDAFKRISGGGRDDTGRTVREAFPELLGQGIIEALDRVYATGEPWVGAEVPIRYDRDGTGPQDTWYTVRYEPVRDAGGAVWGVLNFAVDVTEQVRARREVEGLLAESQAARAEAVAANRAKAEFLATMSHELRTPLNAIGGYAELLAMGVRGPVTTEQAADLDRIRRANQHMAGLVSDVLDFARVDAGQLAYRPTAVDLGPLVQDLEGLLGPQLHARALAYDHDGCGPDTPDRPHVVWADRERVQQILLNLLTNAAKFTAPGGRLALACETDAAAGVVRVRVSDTGRGIAPDQLTRIFEPFVQLERHRTHESQQGVGLGLAISRELARGMGGDLTAESVVGAGSTFVLTLPLMERPPR